MWYQYHTPIKHYRTSTRYMYRYLVIIMRGDSVADPDPDGFTGASRIFLPSSKNSKKALILWLLYDLSLKNEENVPSKSTVISKKNFLLASWRSMTKIAGSWAGAGSVSQRYGSAYTGTYPHPYQNVLDPQHWERGGGRSKSTSSNTVVRRY
jgi:hypothetical protein